MYYIKTQTSTGDIDDKSVLETSAHRNAAHKQDDKKEDIYC